MNGRINFPAIFEILPSITGLPFVRKGRHWYAPCYITGEPSKRWDKLVATLGSDGNGVHIMENGGEATTLYRWLLTHGNCSNDKEVIQVLSRDLSHIFIPPSPPELPSRFVNQNEVKRSDLRHCNLFKYLCTIWDEKRVREAFILYDCYPVWNKYTDSYVTTFLYKDEEGRICFDKQIKYGENGKRDRSFGGGRFFTTSKGYRNKTYFGSHLWGKEEKEPIYVTESEKSSIIFWLRYGKRCIAVGGSNNLREVKPNYRLLPDYDECGKKWCAKFPDNAVKWWEFYPEFELSKGDDISDVILKQYKK